ncbi:unnamed protein product [Tilletia caries]|nr:unnamed protein product [Tilletia caries]
MQPNLYRDAQLQDVGRNESNRISDEGEWMLSYANRSEAKDVLRQHYQTWITEKDFQEMKAMGLNAVRLVIPYWTLEDGPPAYAANLTNATITTATNDTVVPEPFFFKGQRKYVRSALQWAKKYDLQVVLDLHTAPGSQNGFDNSGKAGSIDWDNNPDYYNRTLKCLETMVDWYVNNDDPLYSGIVKAIGVLNEPRVGQSNRTIPIKFLKKFYVESYATIRNRVSAAKGAKTMPTLLFSDGLIGADDWLGWYAAMFKNGTFKRGSVIMDQHLYQAFQPLKKLNRTEHINYTCGISKTLARTQSIVPVIIGEMANALGGVCGYYPTCWNHTMEDDINWYNTAGGNLYFRKLWEAQQLAYEGSAGGWFMWSWKTFAASQWSYRDSVAQGWIPRNLDERVFLPNTTEVEQGRCVSLLPNRNVTFATESKTPPPPPPPPTNSTNTASSSSMLSTSTSLDTSITSTSTSLDTSMTSTSTSLGISMTSTSSSLSTSTLSSSSSSSSSTPTLSSVSSTSVSTTMLTSTTRTPAITSSSTSKSTIRTVTSTAPPKTSSTTKKITSTTTKRSSTSTKQATSTTRKKADEYNEEVYYHKEVDDDEEAHHHKEDVDDDEEGHKNDDVDQEGHKDDDVNEEDANTDSLFLEPKRAKTAAGMANAIAENVFGTIATILWSLQLLPQIIKSYRKKTTEGLSVWLLALWIAAAVPQGVYFVVQNINVPLIIQPQVFNALAIVTLAQCWYYSHGLSRSRCIALGLVLAAIAGSLELGFIFMCKRLPTSGSREAATKAMGFLGAIGLTAGLIPQYVEIWKFKEVRGISFVFLAVDTAGGIFALISLAFKETFDYIGALNYIGIVVAELGILALALILNPRRARARQKERLESDDAGGDTEHSTNELGGETGGLVMENGQRGIEEQLERGQEELVLEQGNEGNPQRAQRDVNMANAIAENVCGTIATILWSTQLLPQIIKSHRNKNTEGLSVWLLVLWIAATVPQSTYFVVQNINLPLIIQPQIFGALAIATLAQCWYYNYGLSRSRCIASGLILAVVAGGLELACISICKGLPTLESREAATKMMGSIGAIGLTAGMIPQYVEIWRLKEVRGISLVFLAIDTAGGVFALLSLAFKERFDYIGALNYVGVVGLELGIFVLALILNPRRARARRLMI